MRGSVATEPASNSAIIAPFGLSYDDARIRGRGGAGCAQGSSHARRAVNPASTFRRYPLNNMCGRSAPTTQTIRANCPPCCPQERLLIHCCYTRSSVAVITHAACNIAESYWRQGSIALPQSSKQIALRSVTCPPQTYLLERPLVTAEVRDKEENVNPLQRLR